MCPQNPYIAGNPIKNKEKFFGRKIIFKDVFNALNNPHSHAIVLYGQRRIGKTSILLQLQQTLQSESQFTPVYFDLQEQAQQPLGELLYQLAIRISTVIGQPIPERDLFDQSGDFFQTTFLAGIKEHTGEGGLVLLFDEFDVLDSPQQENASKSFFPYLRSWMAEIESVQFVFVIGRRPEDLSVNNLSTFKEIPSTPVSRLTKISTEKLIRQSEQNNSLTWHDSAVENLWYLCQGHPYLTQLLCSVVFENAYDDQPTNTPEVDDIDVDNAIDNALRAGRNAFQWIWNGLPPAERIILAAMAETTDNVITQDQLVEILNNSGVRLIIRQLELAPETLVKWELLREVDNGYTFAVPILKLWVEGNHPLRRVKDELDRVEPQAEILYQSAEFFYRQDQFTDAKKQLSHSLDINPNHFKSKLLLGSILRKIGEFDESAEILEAAYQYDQRSAKADLIRSLLAWAKNSGQDQSKQIEVYKRILEIDPHQPIAREKLDHIIQQQRLRKREEKIQIAQQKEANEDWQAAINIYQELLNEFPDDQILISQLNRCDEQNRLLNNYNEAIGASRTGNVQKARGLFGYILFRQPDYKEAFHFLINTEESWLYLLRISMKKLVRSPIALLVLAFSLIIAGGTTYLITELSSRYCSKMIKRENFGDDISCGEEALIDKEFFKNKGIKEFRNGEYEKAVQSFKYSWRENENDPETLIYWNNAQLLASKQKNYKIAAVVPITESHVTPLEDGNFAKEILRGIAQAQTEVNCPLFIEKGSSILPCRNFIPRQSPDYNLNGQGLMIIIADDANQQQQAQNIADKLVTLPELIGVIGHYASDRTVETIPIYNNKQKVLISSSSTTEELSKGEYPYFFRTIPSTKIQAKNLFSFLKKEASTKKIVIFYNQDSPYSRSLKDELCLLLKPKQEVVYLDKEGEIKIFEECTDQDNAKNTANTFDFTKKEFDAKKVMEKLKESEEKYILVLIPDGRVTSSYDNTKKIIRENKGKFLIMGTWSLYTQDLLNYDDMSIEEKETLFKQFVLSIPWNTSTSVNRYFSEKANTLWQGDVNSRTAFSYDAVRVFIKALQDLNKSQPTGEEIQQKLAEVKVEVKFEACGASGQIKFKENGNREMPPGWQPLLVKVKKEKDNLVFKPMNPDEQPWQKCES